MVGEMGVKQLRPKGSATKSGAVALGNLRALVLLGGSVRGSKFSTSIERSVLDLPVEPGRSMLGTWQLEADHLASTAGVPQLQIRVMVDRDSFQPQVRPSQGRTVLSVEQDPIEYRGTGGVLRDLSVGYGAEEYIVVANAAQLLMEPLAPVVQELARLGGDVGVVAHDDGTPSGLMLVRCGVLRELAEVGFIDMKEQALPALAARHDVEVLFRRNPVGLPVRTPAEYTQALRRRCQWKPGTPVDPFEEDWRSVFSIVEDGARIGEGARLHDSVVLRGARVEPGAVLVRSIVCDGGIVDRGRMCVDELVSGGNGPRRGKTNE